MLQWQPSGPAQMRVERPPLRIDALPARWASTPYAREGELLQLIDTRSGEVLGDLRAALEIELVEAPWVGQSIHVRFGFIGSDQILIVDASGERCRLAGGEWQPLSDMQALIDAALAGMQGRGPRRQVHSPDGRIRIDYFEYEHRNNEWLPSPEIHDLDAGTIVFRETHRISNARHEWLEPGRFALIVTNAFLPELVVRFDLDAGTVALEGVTGDRPIAEARPLVESWVRRQERRIEWPAPPVTPRRLGDALRDYDWRFALICGAIAALFMLALVVFGGLI